MPTQSDRPPAFLWFLAIPPLFLLAAALYLRLRSLQGTYGPFLFATLWVAWFTAMAFGTWYGAPKSSMQLTVIKAIIVIDFLFALIWPIISLPSIYKPNPGVLALAVVACALGVVVFCGLSLTNSSPKVDDERHGQNKPFLLIPRSNGFGYKPNLAHPASWILALAPFIILLVGFKFIL